MSIDLKYSHLTVRLAENGVVVSQSGDMGAYGREFVFQSPTDLGDWMANWMYQAKSLQKPSLLDEDGAG